MERFRYRVEAERWRTLQQGTRIYEVRVMVELCSWTDPHGGMGRAWSAIGEARGVSDDPYEARANAAHHAERLHHESLDPAEGSSLSNADLVLPLLGLDPFALTGAADMLAPRIGDSDGL